MFHGICLLSFPTLLLSGRNAVKLSRQAQVFLIAAATLGSAATFISAQTPPPAKRPVINANGNANANASAAVPVPNAPQSTHYPILLLVFGGSPSWDVRIGPKGPELLQRQGYPPIVLEPGEITREGTTDSWIYRAKDTVTSADVAVHLTREACSDSASATKYTFRAEVTHTQIGALEGCARIAAELFPRLPGQSAQVDDDAVDTKDSDKRKVPVIPPITNFKSPVAVAFLSPSGKLIVSHNGIKKIAAPAGSELCLSHDGKKLVYTRADPKPSTLATIVLYDFETARSRDLVRGTVSSAFWSPDDSRVAYLNSVGQTSQVWMLPTDAPERATQYSPQNVLTLQGWSDAHTILATDAQNAYWLSEDKPVQTVVLREIYGDTFQASVSDTLRINPLNPDLLLVSAAYANPPAGSPVDSSGTAYGFFLYELRAKRRTPLSPPDQLARHAEWSRDGLQAFYARRMSASVTWIYRIFWDGSGLRRYVEGSNLVIGQ
jgi:uncharacterized membrane protein